MQWVLSRSRKLWPGWKRVIKGVVVNVHALEGNIVVGHSPINSTFQRYMSNQSCSKLVLLTPITEGCSSLLDNEVAVFNIFIGYGRRRWQSNQN